jgi:hypothetical protein
MSPREAQSSLQDETHGHSSTNLHLVDAHQREKEETIMKTPIICIGAICIAAGSANAGVTVSNDAVDFQNYAGTTLGGLGGTGQSGDATTIDMDFDSQDFFFGPGPTTFDVPNNWWGWADVDIEQSYDVDFATTTGSAGQYQLGVPGLHMATAQGGLQLAQIFWGADIDRVSFIVSGLTEGHPLFGGGLGGNIFNDGAPDPLAISAFGSGIDGSYDVVTIEGDFDELRMTPEFFGFGDMTIHAMSWEVPAPSAMALLGLGGLAATRRRR